MAYGLCVAQVTHPRHTEVSFRFTDNRDSNGLLICLIQTSAMANSGIGLQLHIGVSPQETDLASLRRMQGSITDIIWPRQWRSVNLWALR